MPHHQNHQKIARRLKKGDLVLIDMGVKYKGYCSDMTRMAFTATPTPKQAQIYELVLTAQEAGIRAMKPGVSGKTPDTAAPKILKPFLQDGAYTVDIPGNKPHIFLLIQGVISHGMNTNAELFHQPVDLGDKLMIVKRLREKIIRSQLADILDIPHL